MEKILKFKKLMCLLLISLLLAQGALASPPLCSTVFNNTHSEQNIRYAFGDKNRPLTFGLESEANILENPNVVKYYRLDGYDEATWLGMLESRRIELAREWEIKNKHAFHKAAFHKLPGAPPELNQTLYTEGNGNFEFNGFIFKSLEESKAFIKWFKEHIGDTSMQGHIVMPIGKAHGAAGYTIYSSDRAQFQTFTRNYQRYLQDPNVIPAKNIVHHSLGPLGETNRQVLVSYENAVNEGKPFPAYHSETRVSNGTIFRQKGYPAGFIGWELRQFHKRSEELIQEEEDLSGLLQTPTGLTEFNQFSEVKLISENLFNAVGSFVEPTQAAKWPSYFSSVGAQIRSKFPGLMYGGAPPKIRFLFPLRDWENHPVLNYVTETQKKTLQKNIHTATINYVKDVQNIIDTYASVNDDVLIKLQVLISKWGYETGLVDAFEAFRLKAISGGQSLRGPPSEFQSVTEAMTNHKEMNREELRKHPLSEAIIKNSIEILYQDIAPFGHIQLRVGKRIYAFNNRMSTSIRDFDIDRSGNSIGGLKLVDAATIEKYQNQIEELYASSSKNNVPPFDAYSPLVELVTKADTGYSFQSPSTKYQANDMVKGEVITEGDKKYLKSDSGYKIEIIDKNGKMYVQSYSCSTSAHQVLKQYFGIEIPFGGAKDLLRFIESRPKDFIKIK